LLRLHRKLPSVPPASTQEVSESEVPVHVPLRRPRPFRFERLREIGRASCRGRRLGRAKSEDGKGGEGKVDANLTNFLSTDAACGTPTRRHALTRRPAPTPAARQSATQTAQKTALCAPCEHPGGFGIRGSRSRTASPPASLPIRKAPRDRKSVV